MEIRCKQAVDWVGQQARSLQPTRSARCSFFCSLFWLQLNDLSGEDLASRSCQGPVKCGCRARSSASRLNLNVNGSHVGPLQLESHEAVAPVSPRTGCCNNLIGLLFFWPLHV